MLQRLFKSRPQRAIGQRLYAAAVDQARQPAFYASLGVEDRIDARFELYTVHVVLLMTRLQGEGEQGAEISQALFDAYLEALDHALRELGVGDLSVSKKMRRLGETLYARIKALKAAFETGADPAAIDAVVADAFFAGDQAPRTRLLADYVRRAKADLAAQPTRAIFEGNPTWPPITA